ncbi:hypothetical protein, partial [Ferrimicrobium sp.]|uniref:hypothetical protein n=1 Tax=Ferrimicrobium sp. TaxID=2926050 RepID=UPI00262E7503
PIGLNPLGRSKISSMSLRLVPKLTVLLYGVKSLGDAPRPGVPRTHGDDKIAKDHQTHYHD